MKRLFFKGICIVAVIFFLASCASTSNVNVGPVDNTNLMGSSAIYSLPQTVIDVYVVAEETKVIPGPYQKYAEKYLGIQHAPAKEETQYIIKRITLGKHLEADPDLIYTVRGLTDREKNHAFTSLLKDSLILSAASFAGYQVSAYPPPANRNQVLYTDLSVKRNFEAEKDVEISMVMPDTNYLSRPARMVLKEKTQEQKAEEAANFLIKLKKRRFKLVAGQYDYMPEGESMASAINELARIEEEYLSLFIGKRIVTEVQRSFRYTPEVGKLSDRPVLFRFSPVKGFLDARETEGLPVLLVLEATKKTRELMAKVPAPKLVPNAFPYRIADQANVKLLVGEQLWIDAIMPVFQFGATVYQQN